VINERANICGRGRKPGVCRISFGGDQNDITADPLSGAALENGIAV
jgi:hypothetical protein